MLLVMFCIQMSGALTDYWTGYMHSLMGWGPGVFTRFQLLQFLFTNS